jgi:photosystem II stability/assembly factor-like uncharacterized protein
MRFLLGVLLTAAAVSQTGPKVQISNTQEDLRGVSAVSRQVAWASGMHGTYLRTTDGGRTWTRAQVQDAAALDFRGVVAFSAAEAFLLSAGPGEQSRIYHTGDGGNSWQLEYSEKDPKGFLDSMAFWDDHHGVAVGDPVADRSGKLKFEVLMTDDGQSWRAIPGSQIPDAIGGEGAFAASNTCVAVIPSADDANVWFATGGKAARVFHSSDRGKSWEVAETPIIHGKDSTGIFSIAFRDAMNGVIAGGDYKRPNDDGPNLAFTEDGGKTWKLAALDPLAYFSAAAYDRRAESAIAAGAAKEEAEAKSGKRPPRVRPTPAQRIFLVGQDFVFDFRPPRNPRRISGKKKLFNAASAFPEGGVLVVGPKGSMAIIP